jgi:hypothetical protein
MKRMLRSTVSLVIVSLAVSLGSGCALVRGTTQRVSFYTTEPAATVNLNGKPAGSTHERGTPLVLTLPRNNNYVVTASKDGYKSDSVLINSQISGIGIVDAIGAYLFLIPGISILTGSAMTLTPSEVHVTMQPIQTPVIASPPVALPVVPPGNGAPPIQTQPP